jgi:hypothetical protein
VEPPTLALCGCPNGCVVLRFGYVTVHLPRGVFLSFARRVLGVAAEIERGEPAARTEH